MNDWLKFGNGAINLNNVVRISKGKDKEGKYFATFYYIDKETINFSFDSETELNLLYDEVFVKTENGVGFVTYSSV